MAASASADQLPEQLRPASRQLRHRYFLLGFGAAAGRQAMEQMADAGNNAYAYIDT